MFGTRSAVALAASLLGTQPPVATPPPVSAAAKAAAVKGAKAEAKVLMAAAKAAKAAAVATANAANAANAAAAAAAATAAALAEEAKEIRRKEEAAAKADAQETALAAALAALAVAKDAAAADAAKVEQAQALLLKASQVQEAGRKAAEAAELLALELAASVLDSDLDVLAAPADVFADAEQEFPFVPKYGLNFVPAPTVVETAMTPVQTVTREGMGSAWGMVTSHYLYVIPDTRAGRAEGVAHSLGMECVTVSEDAKKMALQFEKAAKLPELILSIIKFLGHRVTVRGKQPQLTKEKASTLLADFIIGDGEIGEPLNHVAVTKLRAALDVADSQKDTFLANCNFDMSTPAARMAVVAIMVGFEALPIATRVAMIQGMVAPRTVYMVDFYKAAFLLNVNVDGMKHSKEMIAGRLADLIIGA